MVFRTLFATALLLTGGAILPADEPPERKVEFERDIRPLFQKHCYECHGPEMQEAGLRLDLKASAFTGGDSGESIVAGKSGESRLYLYVSGADPDIIMPPEAKLADESVALIKTWIDAGAVWPDDPESALASLSKHWSFQPIARPAVPDEWRGRVQNPIDAFVFARLAEENLTPSPETDRATLIRRLSLDLLGLLPSPEEVERFENDPSPQAYEALVERLLASPHFGERWGRHWLDLARYADSDGYEKDTARPHAWRWRNWVIDSINADQPFDQFTIEQLAGDLLPEATLDQKIATGLHRNTLTNREGGVDREEDRVKATVDRVNTTGSIWTGLTVGCAQCHSHKYDPLTQREYYQLYAFFNSADEADLPAPSEEDRARYEVARQAHTETLQRLEAEWQSYRNGEFETRFRDWLTRVGTSDVRWNPLVAERITSADGVTFTRQEDGSYLVGGENPDAAVYEFVAPISSAGLTALRLDVLPDESLPAQGPGRVEHGNFVLSRFRCFLTEPGADERELTFQRADASHHQAAGTPQAFHPSLSLEGSDPKRGWAIAGEFGKPHSAAFELAEPVTIRESARLRIVLEQNYGSQHTIGRFRLATTSAPAPVSLQPVPEAVASLLERDHATWTDAQRTQAADYYATLDGGAASRRQAVETHRKQAPKLTDQLAQTLIERSSPRKTQVMLRGNFLDLGAEVAAQVPAVLHTTPIDSQPEQNLTRLDLARWLVDPAHPLTRRVTVNRFWQHLFGEGIVRTPDDFGTRGEPPTHPELLDWLAVEFSARGWSRKEMIRLIVTSKTYRQSSRMRPELRDVDPLNRLLARQNRFRVEAEVIRDLFLNASGLLSTRIGGPSVRPPLPSGVRELGYANSVQWPESKGDDRYRRGCYVFFQRTVPYPMLMTFDSPDSNVACVRRERSNTPLQSLTLLNDPVFFECSRALGESLANSAGRDDRERLQQLSRVCFGRSMSSREEEILTGLLYDYRRLADEERAWIGLARVVMNLDEFVTRE